MPTKRRASGVVVAVAVRGRRGGGSHLHSIAVGIGPEHVRGLRALGGIGVLRLLFGLALLRLVLVLGGLGLGLGLPSQDVLMALLSR